MKIPVIAALLIGRSGSSLPDKNILPVLGVPLLLYTAAAARRSNLISRFYVSSDCPKILSVAGQAGYQPIARPPELSSATSQSPDVVRHATEELTRRDGEVDILVVQHANVGTITTDMIDQCIQMILEDKTLSAVVPCHEKNEYHPFRCKTPNADGLLQPFVDFGNSPISGNRQDLPAALFFDHSIWVLSVPRGVWSSDGQPPWTCMGSRIKPYLTTGCFDVHDVEDIKRTEEWIQREQLPIPSFG
jgi:CMP-N-acetylneuraminic acid synthetase